MILLKLGLQVIILFPFFWVMVLLLFEVECIVLFMQLELVLLQVMSLVMNKYKFSHEQKFKRGVKAIMLKISNKFHKVLSISQPIIKFSDWY